MEITYKRILFVLLFSISFIINASSAEMPNFSKTIASRFIKQWVDTPQEKVYLQTDKPYYSAGEDMWFKGYLVNATTHKPNSLSQFIYVELIDKANSVKYRAKIKKDSLGFAGSFKLKPEIPAGYYSLRGYTYWMQNASSDFFYSKNIYIGNNIDDRTTSHIKYGTPMNGNIPVTLTLTNATQKPLVNQKIFINQSWDTTQKKGRVLSTNEEGKISWQIMLDTADRSKKNIEISITEPALKYKNVFFLPEFSTNYDVQFFPESGTLLSGVLQAIAFKAIGADGLSVEVTGKVFSSKNEEITEFSSANKGMGKFVLVPQSDEGYYAIVKSASGIEKRFALPASQTAGVAMHFSYAKDKIMYEIINQSSIPDKSLFLFIHVRGKAFVVQPLNSMNGQITESLLPAGVISFSIVDSAYNTLCERLYFVKNSKLPVVKMESSKANYGKRDLVDMNFNINSALGKSVVGTYSISITDNKLVKIDSLNDNIVSYLLLSSDIKGYIENPAAYFNDNQTSTHEKLDILMLTQGWRRFSTADVVKGKYVQPLFYLEAGQSLAGKVTNLFEKPSKKCNIIMISPYKNMIRMTQTDSLGRYLISGIEFPDSTTIMIKAKKPKSITDVEIIPDQDDFPKVTSLMPNPWIISNDAPMEYFRQSKEKYYFEGGMRVVGLSEVTVTAAKKKTAAESQFYSGLADNQIKGEKLDEMIGLDLLSVLSTIPGVMVNGTEISIRGAQNSPLLLIDNIEAPSLDELSYLTTSDVEDISVFKGANSAIFGSRGGNGVIAITLKKGYLAKAGTPLSIAQIKPLGFQKTTQFYVPKYNIDSVRISSQPDLRTTIYWNPKLVADSIGNVNVKFYTADKSTNYSVVVEGITNEGEICRYRGSLRREGY